MKAYDYEAQFDRNEQRRFKSDQRAWDKLGTQMGSAEALVGELCREGAQVFYINVCSKNGRLTGKTREFATRFDATHYLIRNRYV